ncbi:hypothetical protein GCM10010385_58300 [Streptomyces geysiriensis]|uniref:hypothetical protein n=1 Tax=Streptomyces rochei TaxID=1928 RepID=UPI00177DF117|nr:hypothetical protein GCM10010385_58300 [Streptomyces geysiriensis]
MKLTCHDHRPTADMWDPRCVRCHRPLLDGNITRDELLVRVQAVDPGTTYELTGRQRGTWVEVAQEDTTDVWMFWARPASNIAGFEAVEHPHPNPTGEELGRAFLVEMMSAPAAPAEEIGTAWSRPKPSRWERAIQRYRDWRETSEMREFVSLAAPLVCVELFAVCWILGSDGCAAVAQALWSLVS